MNDYKKVYEDAAKIHDEIERVKKSRKTALNCLDCAYYLNPDEKEFVKKAINAAYEPRIDDLLRKFFTVYEGDKEAAGESKDKTYYEFDFGAWSITVDSGVFDKARYACNRGLCHCDECNLKDIPACICYDIDKKWQRGEYRILHGKEE